MKHSLAPIALSLAVSLAPALPLTAQILPAQLGEEDEEGEVGQGLDLLQEGAGLLLRGLMQEIEPRLNELGALADDMAREIEPSLRALSEEMGPALAELLSRIDSIRHYEAPEFLENGDILIRRRADAPPYQAPEDDEAGPIDL
ncbi:MAG: hypothetical protein JJT81_15120 [Rubellimicrobium sp.]|nr:hypothetical protein [Rubellimicrobium sp.]